MKQLKLNLSKILTATCDELDNIAHLICGTKLNLDDTGVPEYEFETEENSVNIEVSDDCYDDVIEDLENHNINVTRSDETTNTHSIRILDKVVREKLLSSFPSYSSNGTHFTEAKLRIIPSNNTFFKGDTQVRDLSVYKYLNTIGVNLDAFYGCSKLEKFTFPDNMTNYGGNGTWTTFWYCTNLKRVDFNNILNLHNTFMSNTGKVKEIVIRCLKKDDSGAGVNFSWGNNTLEKVMIGSLSLYLTIDHAISAGCPSYAGTATLYYATDENTPITEIIVPDDVTAIAQYVLYNLKTITSFTYNENLTSVGGSALYNCTGLTEDKIYIPSLNWWLTVSFGDSSASHVHLFKKLTINGEDITSIDLNELDPDKTMTSLKSYNLAYNQVLTSYVMHDGITSIGDGHFRYCTGLTNLILPSNLTTINQYTFYGCTNLETINIPEITSIGYRAFANDSKVVITSLPDTITNISGGAFYGCTNFNISKIPDLITSITSPATFSRTGIVNLDLNNVTTITGNLTGTGIDNEASFRNCTKLETVDAPNLTSIGYYSFAGDTSLTTFNAPKLTNLQYGCFNGCSNLILDFTNITTIGLNSLNGCKLIENLGVFKIPDTVTSMGVGPFSGNSNIETLVWTKSYNCGTSAGSWWVLSESNLKYTIFPEGVTMFTGNYNFSQCAKLKQMIFPTTLTSFYTYQKLNSLPSIFMYATTPPTFTCGNNDYNQFNAYFHYLYVPKGYRSTYLATSNWSKISARILEFDPELLPFPTEEDNYDCSKYTDVVDYGKSYSEILEGLGYTDIEAFDVLNEENPNLRKALERKIYLKANNMGFYDPDVEILPSDTIIIKVCNATNNTILNLFSHREWSGTSAINNFNAWIYNSNVVLGSNSATNVKTNLCYSTNAEIYVYKQTKGNVTFNNTSFIVDFTNWTPTTTGLRLLHNQIYSGTTLINSYYAINMQFYYAAVIGEDGIAKRVYLPYEDGKIIDIVTNTIFTGIGSGTAIITTV